MWTEMTGSHATDPLYILMCAEGDEDAAEEYAAVHDSEIQQHNLKVEQETGGLDLGDTGFNEDTEAADISDTSDADIEALIAFVKGAKK